MDDNSDVIIDLHTCCETCNYYDLEQIPEISGPDNCADTLGFMHFNVRGLTGNFNELQHIITSADESNRRIHLILLCETFLKDHNAKFCTLENYRLLCRNRPSRAGGGVAIYVHQSVEFNERPDLDLYVEGKIESIFIEVCLNKKSIIVGEVYRIPHASESESLAHYSQILNSISASGRDVILGTDQNIDLLKLSKKISTRDFLNEFISHGLLPCCDKATRIAHETASSIDNIYVRGFHGRCHAGILETDVSDHFPVMLYIETPHPKKCKNHVEFNFRPVNEQTIHAIDDALLNYDWSCLHQSDVNHAYATFLDVLNRFIDHFAPSKKIKVKKNKIRREPWFTKGLQKSRFTLTKLYKKAADKSKESREYKRYTAYRNQYNNVKRAAKKAHYDKLFDMHRNDIRQTWSVINELQGNSKKKHCAIQKLVINNKDICQPQEIVNSLADFFSNVGPKQAQEIVSTQRSQVDFKRYINYSINNSLYLTPLDEYDILRIIDGFKNKKSRGYDDLNSQFIKQIKVGLAYPLKILINRSFEEGIFPDKLKISKTIALHKRNEKVLVDNYRPISLLSVFSKIFEKAFCNKLVSFITNNNLLSENQYGFRKKRSTSQAVLEFHLQAINSILHNQQMIATFIDLTKAFDTLNHTILLHKMHSLGIRGVAHDWIRSYLENRCLYVEHNGHASHYIQLKPYGVPQGSVLGPILFLLYANDISSCLKHSKYILFADDTTLFVSDEIEDNLYRKMNEDLKGLTDWCNANSLKINVNKTNYMLFNAKTNTNPSRSRLVLADTPLNQVKQFKLLGIFIDEKLLWKEHINYLCIKIGQGLYGLRRVKHYVSNETMKKLYYSLIHSHLNYGNVIWGNAQKKYLNQIIVLQKKAIRIVNNATYNAHTNPLFLQSNVLPLSGIHFLQVSEIMHQLNVEMLPQNLSNCFLQHTHTHPHNLRSNNAYRIPRAVNEISHRSLFIEGHTTWNQLPNEIKLLNKHQFRTKVKHICFDILRD